MSISSLVQQCLRTFQSLRDNELFQNRGHSSKLDNELARFKIWVGNVAAHRNAGRRSLEYRLRDSRNLQVRVQELLRNLLASLHRVVESISTDPDSRSDISTDDDDSSQDSLAFACDWTADDNYTPLEDTHDVITLLYRFSIPLRHAARHDELRQAVTSGSKHFEPYCIAHVAAKYPNAAEYLHKRLGKAIARRRQYYQYRSTHRRKLAEGLESSDEQPHHSAESTVASSLQRTSSFEYAASFVGSDTSSIHSATSFALTISGDESLLPPRLPEAGQNGDPFECPICFDIVSVIDERAWRRHIFEDLPPYICTHKDCLTPDRQYSKRQDWQSHQTRAHNRYWICPFPQCDKKYTKLHRFETHLIDRHDQSPAKSAMHQITEACSRPDEDKSSSECPLCGQFVVPTKSWMKHLSHHLQQLALFSLPQELLAKAEDEESLDEEVDDIEDREPGLSFGSDSSSVEDQVPKTGYHATESSQNARASIKEPEHPPKTLPFKSTLGETSATTNNNWGSSNLAGKEQVISNYLAQHQAYHTAGNAQTTNDVWRDIQHFLSRQQATQSNDLFERLLQAEKARDEAERAKKLLEEQLAMSKPDAMEPLRFKDAVGRKFTFPWPICKTWKGMESLIKQAFLHVDVVGDHVHQGHYDLTGPDGEIILPQVWDSMVKPGYEITMHLWPMEEKKKDPLIDPFAGLNLSGSASHPFAGLGGLSDFTLVPGMTKKKGAGGKKKKRNSPKTSTSDLLNPLMFPPPPESGHGPFPDPFAGFGGDLPPHSMPGTQKSSSAGDKRPSRPEEPKEISRLAAWFAGGESPAKPTKKSR